MKNNLCDTPVFRITVVVLVSILVLFSFQCYSQGTGNSRAFSVSHYKAHVGQYYDTVVQCTGIKIKTSFGREKWLYHIPSFIIRFKRDSLGGIDKSSVKYYYMNGISQFHMIWWTNAPFIPPYDPGKQWEIIGELKTVNNINELSDKQVDSLGHGTNISASNATILE